MSACFAAADLGLALPGVLIGFVSQPIGTVDASAHVAPLLAVVILAAAIVVARTFGRETPADPPAEDAHSVSVAPLGVTHPLPSRGHDRAKSIRDGNGRTTSTSKDPP